MMPWWEFFIDGYCTVSLSVFSVSDDDDTMVDSHTAAAAAERCEIFVSNIPASDNVIKLSAVFESEKVTGIADCWVVSVTYDSNDSTCAVVEFTDHKGTVTVFYTPS